MMPVAAPVTDESGFTLIEALFAIVILMVGLVAVTNLMIIGASSNSVANLSSAASGLASEELEQLKATPYNALVANGSLTADVPGYFRLDGVEGVGQFRTRWVITAPTNQTRFIEVVSEPADGLLRSRARADFTTFRSCTSTSLGCPVGP